MSDNNTHSGGATFIGFISVSLIFMKLMGYVDWSWWVILAPIWVPVAAIASMLILVATVAPKKND